MKTLQCFEADSRLFGVTKMGFGIEPQWPLGV